MLYINAELFNTYFMPSVDSSFSDVDWWKKADSRVPSAIPWASLSSVSVT